VRLGNLAVSPAESSANFRLQQDGRTLVLAALSGSLNVTDGVNSAVLPAGQMMTRAAMDDQEPAPPTPNRRPRGGVPGWVVATIGAATVGAVVGGLAAAGAFSGTTSPSKP
jgi:hypothetical protein